MLSFLYPWWLLAAPLILLPWFFPVFQKESQHSFPFSAFFLLPPESHQQQFQFSWKEQWLKISRSLILLVLILLLAAPFWKSSPPPLEIWVIDDTPSAQSNQVSLDFASNLSGQSPVFLFSELFPSSENTHSTLSSSLQKLLPQGHPGSPNLAQIAEAVLQKQTHNKAETPEIRIHLFSDFQSSQYGVYQTAIQKVQWIFHRPPASAPAKNLAVHQIQLKTQGFFKSTLKMSLRGNFSESAKLRIWVQQQGVKIGERSLTWEGKSRSLSIPLIFEAKTNQPMEIILESEQDEFTADNIRFFQPSFQENLWVGIMTSEGSTGIYRHGLHPLKAALNANAYYSYLLSNSEGLLQFPPHLILLLADHPLRYAEKLVSFSPKLFIPTRLADWKKQVSLSSQGQWMLDWTQVSFAKEWKIKKVTENLYYSQQWNLWLLATGLSSSWGDLYKKSELPDQLNLWVQQMTQKQPQRYAGSFEKGNIPQFLLSASFVGLGHHEIQNMREKDTAVKDTKGKNQSKQTNHFSVNLPQRESNLKLMNDEEWKQMQTYFDAHAPILPPQSLSSANQLKTALLWLLLFVFSVELVLSAMRLYSKTSTVTSAEHTIAKK